MMELDENRQVVAEKVHHETIDTRKMSKPKIKVIKAPSELCPLEEKDFFQLKGGVFHVYEVKSRGRLLVKFLGFPDTGKGKDDVEPSSPA